MKVRTNTKAGMLSGNRCETIKVKTGVKAGAIGHNRCETLRRA